MLTNFNHLEEPILLACSGGADSICLLHLLYKQNKKIICAHFNHRWTPLSEKAIILVKKLCQEFKIPFILGSAKQAGRTSEATARDERYEFLIQTAKENKIKTILTAHHLDDQVETFFLRIFRGTGLNGLNCIQYSRLLDENIQLIRPLLEFEKSTLIDYCQKQNLFFYEDPSNKELDIKRNQIRMQIIPLIERIQPSYKKQINNLIQIVSAQNEFIEDYLQNLDSKTYTNCHFFREQFIAIQRLLIKRLLEEFELTASFDLIEEIRKKILNKEKCKINIKENFYFELNNIRFKIYEELPSINSQIQPLIFNLNQSEIIIPNIAKLNISKMNIKYDEIPKEKNALKVFINLNEFNNHNFVLRSRQAGDRFQPINCNYSIKLKNFLINRKVFKDNLLFLALENSSDILWILGLEISDLIKIKPTQESSHCLAFQSFL